LAALACLALGPVPEAGAQDAPAGKAPEDVIKTMDSEEERPEGWARKLTLGGTFSYSHSSNVVGSPDGANVQLGLVLDGALNWSRDRHAWQNTLQVLQTRSKTPVIDRFIKSLDSFVLQSTYLYSLKQPAKLGLYGRLRVSTQVFAGYEVRAEPTEVLRLFLDGSEVLETVEAEDPIDLTSAFDPLVLAQNAGVFANPIATERLSVGLKLGLGLQEILVGDETFALQDDGATPELELRQLEDVTQGGCVLDLNLAGRLAENVAWKLDTAVFLELFTNSDADADALNLESIGSVSVKLVKWASLDYVLNVRRLPRVVDEWQVQNGLVLTAGFDLF
jgi:hypothetical protein